MRDLKNPLSTSIFDKTPEERQAARKKRVTANMKIKAEKNKAKNERRVATSKSKAEADSNLTKKKDKQVDRAVRVIKEVKTKTKKKTALNYNR
jgi:hypothetical protein